MSKFRFVYFLCVFFLFSSGTSWALDDGLMSMDELKTLIEKSNTGTLPAHFESVPRGRTIKKYEIQIRGVHNSGGIEMIVFTTKHKIVSGMSGSPVYVNGKLVGAVAYRMSTFNFDDLKWGGISPIEKMISDANGEISNNLSQEAYKTQMAGFEPIPLGYIPLSDRSWNLSGGFISLNTLELSEINSEEWVDKEIKPGMPIVVDLLEWEDDEGNITLGGGVGTVTYIDKDGRIFAFGHPILNAKNSTYNFRTCNILGTIFSELNSSRFGGKMSPVMGTIDFDSSYGIYGVFGSAESEKLNHINLEFSKDGEKFKSFKVKIADMSLASILAADALKNIGTFNGAPLDGEPNSTELTVNIELEGYPDISWQDVYPPKEFSFGPSTTRFSSYKSAIDSFFQNLYPAIFGSDFDFKVNSVDIKANFISKQARELRLAYFDFPKKVIWGENPVLGITFISKDNSIALSKKMEVDISWDLIEKPVYDEASKESAKEYSKKVIGTLSIYSSFQHAMSLSDNERNIFYPKYFLNAQDFLEYIERTLSLSSRSVFAKTKIKAKEGLFDAILASNKKNNYSDIRGNVDEKDWTITEGGINTRKIDIKDEGKVPFYIDFPLVPSGFVVSADLSEDFEFEVVLKRGMAEKPEEKQKESDKPEKK